MLDKQPKYIEVALKPWGLVVSILTVSELKHYIEQSLKDAGCIEYIYDACRMRTVYVVKQMPRDMPVLNLLWEEVTL